VEQLRVLRSADGRWRIEQSEREIRVYAGTPGRWFLRHTCRSVAELAAWLRQQGDPGGGEWTED
jgi:hypothetical protein